MREIEGSRVYRGTCCIYASVTVSLLGFARFGSGGGNRASTFFFVRSWGSGNVRMREEILWRESEKRLTYNSTFPVPVFCDCRFRFEVERA